MYKNCEESCLDFGTNACDSCERKQMYFPDDSLKAERGYRISLCRFGCKRCPLKHNCNSVLL
jgi:hypothetical protein